VPEGSVSSIDGDLSTGFELWCERVCWDIWDCSCLAVCWDNETVVVLQCAGIYGAVVVLQCAGIMRL
jgi:hypothetical protein